MNSVVCTWKAPRNSTTLIRFIKLVRVAYLKDVLPTCSKYSASTQDNVNENNYPWENKPWTWVVKKAQNR